MARSLVGRIGSHSVVVWAIKHVASPIDRFAVRVTGGRVPQPSSLVLPTLLLTTVGRRSGQQRTVPLVYVQDDDGYVVANARPAGEHRNPWVINLRAAGTGRVKRRWRSVEVTAHELDESEAARWWPALVDVWPAFDEHFAATGERTIFRLHPLDPGPDGRAGDPPSQSSRHGK